MSSFRLSVRRAGAWAALALSTLLTGCVTYSDSYYADDRYGGDYYYGRSDRYDDHYWGAYAYDSVLWPTYRWYDPWYAPGYYYGVNHSPHWFGLSFGFFGRHGRHHHPWAFHHYSPYRYSWWDNHAWYGGTAWRHGHRDGYNSHRFGSARNEAERIARLEGTRPGATRDGALGAASRYGGAPRSGAWSRGIDYGDGRTARAYGEREVIARDEDGRYARYRDADPRGYGWRIDRDGRGREPDAARVDARELGGGRPEYRGDRPLPYDADAYSRLRDPTPYYDRPMPRPDSGDAPVRYAAPRSEAFHGGSSRPSAPQRSYDAPSFSPPPRSDSGGHGRSDSARQAERFSREPD